MATTYRVDFNFASGPTGTTPPFKTGLWVFDTLDATSGTLDIVHDWWEAATTFRSYLSSAMGIPTITIRGVVSGNVEEESVTGSAPTGSAPDLPGVALRALLLGSRPEGGRNPSMFWPCLSGSVTAGDGTVGSTERSNSNTALNTLRTDLLVGTPGSERFWCAVHRVGGGSTTISQVNSVSVQSTLSWLQRRYR